jgi:lipoprotein NlpD
MVKCFFRCVAAVLICSVLSACISKTSMAPIINAWHQTAASRDTYLVRKGDTVYSIAWAFGLDYRVLAEHNGLRAPYEIRTGQRLKMSSVPRKSIPTRYSVSGNEKVVKVYRGGNPPTASEKPVELSHPQWKNQVVQHWQWPVKGRVLQGYSSALAGNKGWNIGGRLGMPVRAAASGQVVYSGDGLRGYGNLLIIKHNDNYLSAYAYNQALLVKLGQSVKAGQAVAKMGRNNAGRVMLHFEIRHNGRPVDPQRYLR